VTAIAAIASGGRPISPDHVGLLAARLSYRGEAVQTAFLTDGLAFIEARRALRPWDEAPDAPIFDDGEVAVVLDGFLVDRRRLAAELDLRLTSAAPSDRQLIRCAYRRWGIEALGRLRGEFALFIWDHRRRTLVMAGDRWGTREVFYSTGNALVASTEMAAVVTHPEVSPALDEGTVANYLLFGKCMSRPRDGRTIREAVRYLLPAHAMVSENGTRRVFRYWDQPLDRPMLRLAKPDDYLAEFRHVLAEAIKDRLEGVPRAVVHLSGGLDSTSVAAIACDLVRRGELACDLRALTAGFDRLVPDDEAGFARLVGRRYDLPVTFVPLDDFKLTAPPTVTSQPLAHFGTGASPFLEATSAQLGDLIIGGKAGDEVLPPTPLADVLGRLPVLDQVRLYRWLWAMSGQRPVLGGRRSYVRKLLRQPPTPAAPGWSFPPWLEPDFIRRCDLEERWRSFWLCDREAVRLHPTQPEILELLRFSAMNLRLEFPDPPAYRPVDTAVPFVDERVVDFVLGLPPWPWNRRKALLRQAMVDLLPREVLDRRKTPAPPFPVVLLHQPEATWVDSWSPTETLRRYVVRDLVPPIYKTDSPERAVVDSQPMFFNAWLEAYGFD
jgi:asparagine synthase (glutamine-hydrolysing)